MLRPTADYTFVASALASLALFLRRIRHLEFENDLLTFLRALNLLLGVRLQDLRATLGDRLASNVLDENVFRLGSLFFWLLRSVF
jgi:hypothetical protein